MQYFSYFISLTIMSKFEARYLFSKIFREGLVSIFFSVIKVYLNVKYFHLKNLEILLQSVWFDYESIFSCLYYC